MPQGTNAALCRAPGKLAQFANQHCICFAKPLTTPPQSIGQRQVGRGISQPIKPLVLGWEGVGDPTTDEATPLTLAPALTQWLWHWCLSFVSCFLAASACLAWPPVFCDMKALAINTSSRLRSLCHVFLLHPPGECRVRECKVPLPLQLLESLHSEMLPMAPTLH